MNITNSQSILAGLKVVLDEWKMELNKSALCVRVQALCVAIIGGLDKSEGIKTQGLWDYPVL